MTHMDHVIRMSYKDYVIHKNKNHLNVFLKFCFTAGCTSNMLGAPSKALWWVQINEMEHVRNNQRDKSEKKETNKNQIKKISAIK